MDGGTGRSITNEQSTGRRVFLEALGSTALLASFAGCSSDETSEDDADSADDSGDSTTNGSDDSHSSIEGTDVEPTTPPQATFSADFDLDSREAVLTHTGGDQLTAGNIAVRHDGRRIGWYELPDTPDDPEEPIVAGTSGTVTEIVSGEEIRIVYEGETSLILAVFDVP